MSHGALLDRRQGVQQDGRQDQPRPPVIPCHGPRHVRPPMSDHRGGVQEQGLPELLLEAEVRPVYE